MTFQRSIVSKMTIRLILIELAVLFLVVILSNFVFLPRLRNNGLHNAGKIMDNLAAQIENRMNDYASYSRFIMYDKSLEESLRTYRTEPGDRNYNRVCLYLSSIMSNSNIIRGLQLAAPDGTIFHSVVNLREADFSQIDNSWYQEVLLNKKSQAFSSIYDPGMSAPSDSLAYARNYYIGSQPYILTIFFNCSNLVSVIESGLSEFDGLLITDYFKTPFTEMGDIGSSYSIAEKVLSPKATSVRDSYSEASYFFRQIEICSWRLIGHISDASLLENYWSIFYAGIFLCVALCILTLIVAIPTMRIIVKPIHTLSDTMQKVSSGDLKIVASVDSNDEIGNLSRIFNSMLENLNNYMTEKIRFNRRENRMRYNLLLAQIDSHFIGNTMSTINILIRRGRGDEAVRLNTALLKIIQDNLRIKELDNTDTLVQEIEMVQQYWLIMKVREENHVNLTWKIPDELLECALPKNIIQPVVENSLFHGLINEETGEMHGEIIVSAFSTGETLTIQISDNGRGIAPEILKQLNNTAEDPEIFHKRGRHIGLSNIRKRLFYIYQKECMEIYCDGGTVVRIDIPLEEPDK